MRGLDVDLIGFRDLGKDLVRFFETVDDCDDPEADLSILLASSLGLASMMNPGEQDNSRFQVVYFQGDRILIRSFALVC